MAVESTETAWRIQAAVADLTAKADSKASFALTMQSTALAVLGLLASSQRAAGDLDSGASRLLLWCGALLMVGGAVRRLGHLAEPPKGAAGAGT
ncbi:hypothetical protein SHIRM173S_02032 [Streptomyces hirsutus]